MILKNDGVMLNDSAVSNRSAGVFNLEQKK